MSAHSFAAVAYGVRIAFEANLNCWSAWLGAFRPVEGRTGCGGRRRYSLVAGESDRESDALELRDETGVVTLAACLEDLLDVLEAEVALNVAARARPWLFMHAGVVSWKSRAIVVPVRPHESRTWRSKRCPGSWVYDVDGQKAHCLNRTAAFVWQRCDGTRTVAQIAGCWRIFRPRRPRHW